MKKLPMETRVRISHDLENTKMRWGIIPEMEKMKGNVYQITNHAQDCMTIAGWSFYEGDVTPVEVEEKPPIIFMFDPDNIDN